MRLQTKTKRVRKVKHHVPEMVWSHKFEDTSTADIRTPSGGRWDSRMLNEAAVSYTLLYSESSTQSQS